jgi:hypothetical protein
VFDAPEPADPEPPAPGLKNSEPAPPFAALLFPPPVVFEPVVFEPVVFVPPLFVPSIGNGG